MYKKILVPIDGSAQSLEAMNHAVKLSSETNALITLFHVVNAIPPTLNKYGDRAGSPNGTPENCLKSEGNAVLENAYNQITQVYQFVETKLGWGNPAQEINTEAARGEYDLIVMGCRGLGELASFVLGSVSKKVICQTPCPVLVVR